MSKCIELLLVFVAALAFTTGIIAFFGFLTADFTMFPIMVGCAVVFAVCAKTSNSLMLKRLGL